MTSKKYIPPGNATGKYILRGTEPVSCPNVMEWGQWMEDNRSVIASDEVVPGVRVSTIFLGLDHNHGEGPPILFETMVFGGEHDHEQQRYHTWDEAIKGHAWMVVQCLTDSSLSISRLMGES